jgi:hypothetical protein
MGQLQTILFLFAIIFLPSAHALSCYEKSSSFAKLGDDYFNLDNNLTVNSKDRKAAASIVKNLRGKWQGTIVETECKGPDREPEEKIKNVKLKATFLSSSNDLIRADLQKKYIEDGRSENDKFLLINKDAIFDFNVSGNVIKATEKQRRRLVETDASRLVEITSSITVKGDSAIIELTHYSNGVYVFHQLFKLKKGR